MAQPAQNQECQSNRENPEGSFDPPFQKSFDHPNLKKQKGGLDPGQRSMKGDHRERFPQWFLANLKKDPVKVMGDQGKHDQRQGMDLGVYVNPLIIFKIPVIPEKPEIKIKTERQSI